MKLVKEEISFDYEGENYKASRATFEQAEMILEQLAEIGEDGLAALKIQKEFLMKSGLPLELIKSLQMNHIKILFEEILGAKKD